MHSRHTAIFTACLAFGVGSAGAAEPVERLTGPQEIILSGIEPFDSFVGVTGEGSAFANSYDPMRAEPNAILRVDLDGSVTVIPLAGTVSGGIWSIADNGSWGYGSTQYSYDPGECSLEFGSSSSRMLRIDLDTGDRSFFTPLCPNFVARGMTVDGASVAGAMYRGDRSFSYVDSEIVEAVTDAVVWRAGETTRLALPDFPSIPANEIGSIARSISADGRIVVGDASINNPEASEPPFGEAIRWVDGVPELLPHFLSAGAEFQTSAVHRVSADGTAMTGRTIDWAFETDDSGEGYWAWTTQTNWYARDGVLIDIEESDRYDALYGITGDGLLVYGTHYGNGSIWHGIVWTEANGLERADAFLARQGVDLDGQLVRRVVDVSNNGHWMLVTLRVDDEHEQYTRISIPCSAADITADRVIAMDDLAAYADRFLAGNPLADLTGDGVLDLADIVGYITLFEAGCGG